MLEFPCSVAFMPLRHLFCQLHSLTRHAMPTKSEKPETPYPSKPRQTQPRSPIDAKPGPQADT